MEVQVGMFYIRSLPIFVNCNHNLSNNHHLNVLSSIPMVVVLGSYTFYYKVFLLMYVANFSLDFASGSPGGNSLRCTSELSCSTRAACPGWSGITMTEMEPTTFSVTIGLSGGLRGYQSITGRHRRIISASLYSSCHVMFQDCRGGE